MAEKTKKFKISKKNLFYALWVVALIAVMTAAIIIVSTLGAKENNGIIDASGNSQSSTGGSSDNVPDTSEPDDPSPDVPGDNQGGVNEPEPNEPVVGKITFIMPCANATVLKSYTSDTVVFNSTLGAYTGHLAVDYSAQSGTEVLCVYDGVVESVTTSYLTGTTVTVNHGNNLKTVYNSIDANEALYEGKSVSQGDVLGYVSANNLQEYKDGPHLHFEVLKDGEKIDPEEYLIGDEK